MAKTGDAISDTPPNPDHNCLRAATSRDDCVELDDDDALRHLRERFCLPDDLIYLDGNSLGPLTARARQRLEEAVVQEWGRGLIGSWNTADWINLPERVGARIATLLGAGPGDVTVDDSTSVCLFRLASAALQILTRPVRIVCEAENFPTDLYVLQGIAESMPGVELIVKPRTQVLRSVVPGVSLLVLTHVHYKTGETYSLKEVNARAHEVGALTLWDLSHSVGAMPLDVEANGCDLAVGCTYKYLNGGPGSPAFSYVSPALQSKLVSPLRGWMGHAEPFAFSDHFRPASGVRRLRCGTPSVLALSALDGALDVWDGVDLRAIRAKSVALGTLFRRLARDLCAGFGLELASPDDAALCGSHVVYRHAKAFEIAQALIEKGIVGDFRAPDLLRFGFSPMIVRYVDVWDAVSTLRDLLVTRDYEQDRFSHRGLVT